MKNGKNHSNTSKTPPNTPDNPPGPPFSLRQNMHIPWAFNVRPNFFTSTLKLLSFIPHWFNNNWSDQNILWLWVTILENQWTKTFYIHTTCCQLPSEDISQRSMITKGYLRSGELIFCENSMKMYKNACLVRRCYDFKMSNLKTSEVRPFKFTLHAENSNLVMYSKDQSYWWETLGLVIDASMYSFILLILNTETKSLDITISGFVKGICSMFSIFQVYICCYAVTKDRHIPSRHSHDRVYWILTCI